jgi:hypothetical protein
MEFGILPLVPTWVLVHPRGMGPVLRRLSLFPKLSDIKKIVNFSKIKNLVSLHLEKKKSRNSPSLGFLNSNFFGEKSVVLSSSSLYMTKFPKKLKKTWLIYTGKTRFS